MEQQQKGPCAFTAACTVPGPRVRVTKNQAYCVMHARVLDMPVAQERGGTEFARTRYRKTRRRSDWQLYAGMVEMA